MKIFILFLTLAFGFQFWAKADDIRDFEIEGISIGESALDFFSEKELNNAYEIYDYKDKKFRYYFLSYKNSNTYEYLQITVIPSDKKFIIHGVEGVILYENNIDDCYKKMENIKQEISDVLNKTSKNDEGSHPGYKNTTYKRAVFYFENGRADLVCYDIDEKINKTDRFSITLLNEELNNFLTYEAYE